CARVLPPTSYEDDYGDYFADYW
nr:immunoglobulin heavy chain junction region [Macaca mulatta]MOW78929.1 immunoglobulin heavy chain junction region [Macaca mulatta]MOW81131.1 immunoglobulin heavy chain junction region [Macaca mulatta]MOW84941.1 immunoglobulin heavy chain junction region [Macaca mulatta]